MKFHEWETLFETMDRSKRPPLSKWVALCESSYAKMKTPAHRAEYLIEACYWSELRPYYKVWPAIMRAILGIKLDVPVSSLKRDRYKVAAIRFAQGSEVVVANMRFTSILTMVDACGLLAAADFLVDGQPTHITPLIVRFADEGTLEDAIARHEITELAPGSFDVRLAAETALRVAAMVWLIEDDPEVITPDVLAKDRERYDSETDEEWKQRAVERAKRRGVVGWNIGADYEVCPHYRRPHFGLRHTGKGRTVPRIVPIKGAVVHRNRLTEVPTGWMTPDGREVEPVR